MEVYTNQHVCLSVCVCVCLTQKMYIYMYTCMYKLLSGANERQTTISISCQIKYGKENYKCCGFLECCYKVGGRLLESIRRN